MYSHSWKHVAASLMHVVCGHARLLLGWTPVLRWWTHTYTIIIVPTPDGQQQLGELTVQPNQNLIDGSFGTVYKASYQGTPAAAKYLYCQVRDQGSFKCELEALEGLTHPNLVACQAAFSPQSRYCPILVMELMEETPTQFLWRNRAQHPDPFPSQPLARYHFRTTSIPEA